MTTPRNLADWQLALSTAVTDPKELLTLLELDDCYLENARAAAKLFPLKVPRGFIARMKKGDIHDPLLQQVLPIGCELNEVTGYENDPLDEKNANPIRGLLHKYHGRVLLTLVGTCGVNCRFCFRRNFPYAENNPGKEGWNAIFSYIQNDPTIQEVILSGGDPLVANDLLLQSFSDQLADISHVKILRIHSRMPIVLPERISPEFIRWISSIKQKPVMIMHSNHPQEIDFSVKKATKMLLDAGVTVLNQSVLLKGINDNAETLIALSETLFAAGILPYYLHALDKVKGTAHFDMDLLQAQQLHATITKRLPGYLVPRLVCEQPGKPAKTPLINPEFYT